MDVYSRTSRKQAVIRWKSEDSITQCSRWVVGGWHRVGLHRFHYTVQKKKYGVGHIIILYYVAHYYCNINIVTSCSVKREQNIHTIHVTLVRSWLGETELSSAARRNVRHYHTTLIIFHLSPIFTRGRTRNGIARFYNIKRCLTTKWQVTNEPSYH